jgi:pilus assembly protein Flp/PilA
MLSAHRPAVHRRRLPSVRSLLADRRGASLVEYIILVGIVALIAFGGFKYFGSQVTQKIHDQGSSVSNVNGALGN